MRKRLLLAVMALSLLFVTPALAQADLERARADVGQATERVEQSLADIRATQQRGDELAGEYWQVQSGLQRIDLDISATELTAADLQAQVEALRSDVKVIAVDQYMNRAEGLAVGDHESEADRAAAAALARLVVGTNNGAIDQLAVVRARQDVVLEDLAEQRSSQAAQLAEVEATQASIAQELERLTRLQATLVGELDELQQALGELEAIEAQRQAEAAERERIAEERRRAEAAVAAAAQAARAVPTPAATAVPNPQPAATAVPNPQTLEPLPTEFPPAESAAGPEATAVPNPQPSAPLPGAGVGIDEPQTTAVPNPQPSEPLPSQQPTDPAPGEAGPTAIPNPQPSQPLPTPPPDPAPAQVVASGGGIVCPLAGPFTHTDDFSAPRQVGGIHRANDLIAAQGTPVLAAASGTIEHRNSSVGGMSAHLKGDNGDYYFYTHLSGYENVGAGRVGAGSVIGYVGMTGNAPIPHLHFEIHKGGYGNYSNPYGPVRAACF